MLSICALPANTGDFPSYVGPTLEGSQPNFKAYSHKGLNCSFSNMLFLDRLDEVHCIEVHCIEVHCIEVHCIEVYCIEVYCIEVYCIEVLRRQLVRAVTSSPIPARLEQVSLWTTLRGPGGQERTLQRRASPGHLR